MSTDQTAADEAASNADIHAQYLRDLELQDRYLLRLLPAVLSELRGTSEALDEDPRVRWAAGAAIIASSERVARACRRDLPEHQS